MAIAIALYGRLLHSHSHTHTLTHEMLLLSRCHRRRRRRSLCNSRANVNRVCARTRPPVSPSDQGHIEFAPANQRCPAENQRPPLESRVCTDDDDDDDFCAGQVRRNVMSVYMNRELFCVARYIFVRRQNRAPGTTRQCQSWATILITSTLDVQQINSAEGTSVYTEQTSHHPHRTG